MWDSYLLHCSPFRACTLHGRKSHGGNKLKWTGFFTQKQFVFLIEDHTDNPAAFWKCNWNTGSGLKGFCSALVCNALIGVGHINQGCCLLQRLVWFDDFFPSEVNWAHSKSMRKNSSWDKQAMSILNIRKKKTYLHGKALLVYIFCSNYVSITIAKECTHTMLFTLD